MAADDKKSKTELLEELRSLREENTRLLTVTAAGDEAAWRRVLFDSMPVMMHSIDREGRLISVSDYWLNAMGYERGEVLGRKSVEFLTEDSRRYAIETILPAFLAAGSCVDVPYQFVKKNGEIMDVLLSATAERDLYGGVARSVAVSIDVTARKRAEEALRASEEHHWKLMDVSLDAIVIHCEGRIVFANQTAIQVLGASSRDELLGRPALDFVHPDYHQVVRNRLADFRKATTATFTEETLRRIDGSSFDAELATLPYVWDGKIAIQAIFRDMTRRKQAEEALRESELRFRQVFEEGPVGMVIIGADYQITQANGALCRMLGYSEAELISMGVAAITHPEDYPKDLELVRKLTAGETSSYQLEKRYIRKDGAVIWGRLTASLAPEPHGPRKYGLGVVEDITERKLAEEARSKLEAQVLYAQKLESLGVLAGGIAHDFNNLLTGILGNADLALADLPPASPVRTNIQQIEMAAHRAADLTRQMLAYSGRGSFVIQPVRLSEVVEEMAHLLEISISKKSVLRYDFAKSVPVVNADATQLRQVIMNLIINASEAIGEKDGVITVRTGATECDRAYLSESPLDEALSEGVYVYLEVADTGCGMTEEVQSKLFDPFFTTKFTGRGLGLAAVLGIVRSHRGIIKVHSELGRGSAFRVLFPAATGVGTTPPKTPVPAPSWIGTGLILVVDDDETVRSLAKTMLERAGFSVLTAADGREAIEVYRSRYEDIRAVLLDMTMPHLDGAEAFEEIRRIHDGARVVLISGYSEQDATSRFTGQGLAGFVQKPFGSGDLTAAVRKAIDAE
ncbi:MAG: PAS domain S-box protein [Candidatus Hydrogenedentes bacterium]|nr:PAS domain S-box protein [Candidatus Hydrogenedentota bacterium]